MKRIVFVIILLCCFNTMFSQRMLMSWGQQTIEGWTKEKWELAQTLTVKQLLERNLTVESWSDFFAILNASVNNYATNQEYLNSLVEQITDTTETMLTGTSRLIIWDRIISGDIIFEGRGIVFENDLFKVGGRANQILQNLTNKNFGYVSINSTEEELQELKNRWLRFLSNEPVEEFRTPELKNARIEVISNLRAFNALVVSLQDSPRKEEIIRNCLRNIYNLDRMPRNRNSPAQMCNPDRFTLSYLGMLIGDERQDRRKNAQWWQNFWNENKENLTWNDEKGHFEVKNK